ncbi:hypothetical protein HNQ07_001426 [Deinococcus metalli]|uniref:RHS repeat protein n=1 Tax=Deinococcus metalli TaxID=1141878 RepID=A0A7W8KD50_9DEIO|nr:hypothetical protein [Deinococcus metalli]MBB5375969.1 hypothetical protein [Deinococcus metalli]GHF41792.1 hypothetical protein GCM10017781_18150 [Deinococcus metalli]
MRSVLCVLLCAASSAQAAFCFDAPGEERAVFQTFAGQPRVVVETSTRWMQGQPDAPPALSTRTSTFQAGRPVQVHRSVQGGATQSVWRFGALQQNTVRGTYQRASDALTALLAGKSELTIDKVLLTPARPITATFDTLGRLSTLTGVFENDTLSAVKLQVSCTYSARSRQTSERVTLAGTIRFTRVATVDLQGRLVTTESSSSAPGTNGDTTPVVTTYVYGSDGHLTGSEATQGNQLVVRQTYTTDAAGRVTSLQFADLGDVQERWTWTYDDHGNWITQTGRVQDRPFETITRTITY